MRRVLTLILSSVLAAGVVAKLQSASPAPSAMLRAQVLLDRAGFSPGEIDGRGGPNTTRALEAFQRARGLDVTGRPDGATLDALGGDGGEVLVERTLTGQDVAGPWVQVPEDLMAQAMLTSLGYTSALERLAEQVHASPSLLRALNPGASFARAGETVRVPAVATADAVEPVAIGTTGGETDVRPVRATGGARDLVVRVSKAASTLTVAAAGGGILMHAPVTVGSEYDPLPIGEWTVTSVLRDPVFHYNPDLFWDADPAHAKAVLRPGPNNPVGVAWIGISREHYGLHGTPEPGLVGHAASHGCVRLTNWDASRLASLVTRGTRVLFEE